MKKNSSKLVPDSLPSLFKTIKRSYSPDPTNGYVINLDDMKTKKISIKDQQTIIPPLQFKNKISYKCNTNGNQPYERQNSKIRLNQVTCATQRPSSYRIRKIDSSSVNVRNNPSISKLQSIQKQNTKVDFNTLKKLDLKEFKQIAETKIATDRKSRRYPQCKIIKSKQIPFDLIINKTNTKKKQEIFLDDISIISEIEKTEQPFISIESYNFLQF